MKERNEDWSEKKGKTRQSVGCSYWLVTVRRLDKVMVQNLDILEII